MKNKPASNSKPTIINYITISGKTECLDTLPLERRREIAEMLSDRMMQTIGFERVTPRDTA